MGQLFAPYLGVNFCTLVTMLIVHSQYVNVLFIVNFTCLPSLPSLPILPAESAVITSYLIHHLMMSPKFDIRAM